MQAALRREQEAGAAAAQARRDAAAAADAARQQAAARAAAEAQLALLAAEAGDLRGRAARAEADAAAGHATAATLEGRLAAAAQGGGGGAGHSGSGGGHRPGASPLRDVVGAMRSELAERELALMSAGEELAAERRRCAELAQQVMDQVGDCEAPSFLLQAAGPSTRPPLG